ncbi:hypothetical protein LOS22_15145 [Enterococcus faecium]|nr:hypothetical protein [Enterococcus faecium]
MEKLARETIKKPIEFIYNGNYTQEEMYYFMEERKRLKGIKNENKTVDKEKYTWYIIHVNKGNTYSDELKKKSIKILVKTIDKKK